MFVLDDEVVFEATGGAQYVDWTVVFVILLWFAVYHVLYKLPPYHYHIIISIIITSFLFLPTSLEGLRYIVF